MDTAEQTAFDLGWDFAIFDRDVPPGANKAFCDGYRAFKQGNKRGTRLPDKFERKWLQVRFGAMRRGKFFSPEITPQYLEKITPGSGLCPVTLKPLSFAATESTDWSVDRANNDRGYVRGNLIVISTLANSAKSDRSLDEIWSLSELDFMTDGLAPEDWARLAELIEPAFGDHEDEVSPVPVLMGQPVALGMPISPIASFQVSISRVLIEGWDEEKRDLMSSFNAAMCEFLCKTKKQNRAYFRLMAAILRRSKHIRDYADIWATKRVQRRLFDLINTLGAAGLTRLAKLQEVTIGEENARIQWPED